MLVSSAVDIVIINTPLPDDFGVELAIDISDAPMGVLLLVKNELFVQVSYRVGGQRCFDAWKAKFQAGCIRGH